MGKNPQAQLDPNGKLNTYDYNDYGQIVETVRAAGTDSAITTTYSYDELGRLTTTTQASGSESHTSLNVYDAGNRLVATISNWTGSTPANWLTDCDTSQGARDSNICTRYGYDAANRTISTTNTLGQTNLTFYDEAGRVVTSVVNYDGTTSTDSLCTDLSNPDPEYNICSLTAYDEVGRVVSTTDSLGRVSQTDYDPLGRVSRSIRNLTHIPTDTYPFSCDFRTIQGSAVDEDLCTLYEYDAVGNTILVTDTAGRMSRTFYDEMNRVKASVSNWTNTLTASADCNFPPTQPDTNLCTVYEYDELGNTIVVTDSLGRRTRTFYDELNRVEYTVQNWQFTFTDPSSCTFSTTNTQTENICTHYTYDAVGNQVETTNALNQTTLTVYDEANRPYLTVRHWDGTTTLTSHSACLLAATSESEHNLCTSTTYDGLGRRASTLNEVGDTTTFSYDGLGRVITTTYDSNTIPSVSRQTSTQFDAMGNRLSQTDANGHTTTTSYDSLHRQVTTTSAEGVVMTQTYDAASRVLQVTDALNQSHTSQYDGLDRLITSTTPLHHQTVYEYDLAGNQVVVTDALGIRTAYQYDDLNRLLSVTENEDPSTPSSTADRNVTTEYEYDALGNRSVIVNALENTHTTTRYDALNRPIARANGLGITTTFGYDALGNRLTLVDGNGFTTTYAYDGLNRLTTITYEEDSEMVHYAYSPLGQRLRMTDSLGVTSYQYDSVRRLQSVNNPYTQTVSYGYDDGGNRTSLTYPDSKQVTYLYDQDNRLTTVTDWDGNQTTYEYDIAGRLTTTILPNGVETAYGYDGDNRLTSLSHSDGFGGLVALYEYELDAMGNRIVVTETQRMPFDVGGMALLPDSLTADEILAQAIQPPLLERGTAGKPLVLMSQLDQTPPLALPLASTTVNPLAYTSLLNLEPMVVNLALTVHSEELPADGFSHATFTVVATTQLGTPVPDGTPIYLEGAGIHLPRWAFTTVDGQVTGQLISGQRAGLARLTAWADGARDSVTLTLVPPVTPLSDQSLQEQPEVPFDAQEIVEASRNQIDTSGDTPILHRPDHTATFIADGLQFTPAVGRGTDSFRVSLAGVQVGESAVRLNVSPAHPTIEGHVARLERGNQVVEEFIARDAGIEQRWWLATPPRGNGDLQLTLAIDTPFLLTEDNRVDGYLFTLRDSTPAVRYGQATAIDAVGHSKRAQMEVTNQRWDEENRQWHYEVTIRVPADWLAQATFPLLIDPLIGNPHYTSEGSGNQAQPAIAYNSTNDEYMVVWQDNREGTPQLYGQVVNNYHYDPDSNFTITADTYTSTLPALAYNADANEYLVVWEKNETDIGAQRLASDGQTLSATLTITTSNAGTPDVAYSASADRWLVTWAQNSKIYARSVYTDNGLGTTFVISNSTGAANPTIAANSDGGYLIAWQQGVTEISGTLDIAARRVTTATTDGSIYMMTISRTQQTPDLTFNPDRNEYFLVWQTLNDASGYDTIYGRQGQVSGSLWVTDSVQIRDSADASAPAVSYTADEKYLVAWTELGTGGQTEIMGQQVLSTAVTSGDVISILIEAENQLDVALASGSTEVLLAWTDNRHPTEDVYARFWQLEGEMEGDFRLHPTAGDQNNPEVAYNEDEDEYLVVWMHYETVSNPNIYAQRVSGAGALVGGNITVAATDAQETGPVVSYASGENTYLVAWRSYSSTATTVSDINVQRLSSVGVLVGDVITDLDGANNTTAGMGDVVYNGTENHFFVVWSARLPSSYNSNIWGQTIDLSGSTGTRLAITPEDNGHQEGEPQVSYNATDNEYLVVWTYAVTASVDSDIYGRRVTSAGVVITPSVAIITGTSYQLQPAIVYESQANHYLVVAASDPDGNGKYEIVGQVVSQTGVLVGSIITISDDTNNEVQPTIALDGDGNAMVVWHRWQGGILPERTMYDLFGRRLTGEGVLLEDVFEVLSVGQDQTQAALAGNGYENYLLAWRDQRSGDKDVYVSLFQALQAQFSISPTLGEAGAPIQFTDTSLPAGVADEWLWDFGDGSSTSSEQHPVYTYTNQGLYTVTLTVTNTATGEVDTWSRTVPVGKTNRTIITYEYNDLYRLTQAVYTDAITATYQYVYDAVGNMLILTKTLTSTQVTTYSYNVGYQLVTAKLNTSADTWYYVYDDNGNQIRQVPNGLTPAAGEMRYTFNQRNLLTKVETHDGSNYEVQAEMIYDGNNGRLRTIAYIAGLPVTSTITLDAQQGNTILAVSTGGVTTTLLYGGIFGIGEYNSDWQYYLEDASLSVRQLVEADTNILLVRTYDPLGNLLSIEGNGSSLYSFAGLQPSALNLLYRDGRYFDPATGRFLTPDYDNFDSEHPSRRINPYIFAIVFANPGSILFAPLLYLNWRRRKNGKPLSPPVTWLMLGTVLMVGFGLSSCKRAVGIPKADATEVLTAVKASATSHISESRTPISPSGTLPPPPTVESSLPISSATPPIIVCPTPTSTSTPSSTPMPVSTPTLAPTITPEGLPDSSIIITSDDIAQAGSLEDYLRSEPPAMMLARVAMGESLAGPKDREYVMWIVKIRMELGYTKGTLRPKGTPLVSWSPDRSSTDAFSEAFNRKQFQPVRDVLNDYLPGDFTDPSVMYGSSSNLRAMLSPTPEQLPSFREALSRASNILGANVKSSMPEEIKGYDRFLGAGNASQVGDSAYSLGRPTQQFFKADPITGIGAGNVYFDSFPGDNIYLGLLDCETVRTVNGEYELVQGLLKVKETTCPSGY